MSQNLVSITITPEQVAAVMEALARIEEQLKELITLDPAQRKKMTFAGAKTVDFTRTTIRAASNNPDVLPRNLDIEEAQADMAALEALLPILERVSQLSRRLEDTIAALGSDTYYAARKSYAQLKLSGLAAGLEDLVKSLSGTFSRSRRKKEKA